MSTPQYETRREVDAALGARAELGPEYHDQIAAGLADRVEQLAAFRTAEIRRDLEVSQGGDRVAAQTVRNQFVLGIITVGTAIPITAIAIVQGGLIETVISWAGLVGINVAHSLAGRKHRH